MKYLSAKEAADKWGISDRRVQILCNQDRIPGVIRIGNIWGIPDDAEKPKDERVKSGRYIKTKAQSQNLWDLGFRTYSLRLMSNSFRKKYSSSG